jgi:hypothetical protein
VNRTVQLIPAWEGQTESAVAVPQEKRDCKNPSGVYNNILTRLYPDAFNLYHFLE